MANMGKSMNSSSLMTGFVNAAAGVIDAAANSVAPETDLDRYNRLAGLKSDIYGFEQSGGVLDSLRAQGFGQTFDQLGGDAELQRLREKIADDQFAAAAKDAADAGRAPFVAAAPIAQDVDKRSGEVKKITENINQLQKAYDAFQARPDLFEPQEVERLKQFPQLIAALRIQLEGTKTPLEDYVSKTKRMAENLATYGAGGASSLADEARALVDSAAKAGVAVDMNEALAAVTSRRMVATQQATQAMDADIAAQQRTMDAIGKGTQAQIDAEVATKAMAYQLQNFGTEVGGPVTVAVERYADKLRELLQIQRDAADAQREYNAEVQLGIEKQISAAIRAGATAGEIAALRAELQSGLAFGDAVAGDASSVRVGGTGIPPELQGYFDKASAASGIPTALLAAVAQQESNFRFDAVSPTGARGIMQVLPSTAEDPGYRVTPVSRDKLFDPETNIMFGAQYLRGRAESAGLDISNPNDLRKLLRAYNGSDTPMGDKNYDSAVLARLPQGAQAASAEAQLNAERAAQQSAERIAQLEKEAASLRAQAGAGSMTEAQRLAREDRVRKAGESAQNPEDRVALENAMREKLEAEDDAAIASRRRAIEEEIELEKEQARIAKLPAREREIEKRVIEEVNRLKQQGIELDQAQIDLIRANITKAVNLDLAGETKSDREKFEEVWTSSAQSIGSALEAAMSQALNNGKIEAEDILKGLVADITMAIFKAYVTKPLVDGLIGLIGAQGFVSDAAGTRMGYAHGGVLAFAGGGVVNSPTLFPMANGAGLMGEAGPEAVLPLKRGTDGKLGVGAGGGGGGTTVVVNDMRQAPGAEPVEVQETEGPDGQRMLSIMVRDEVRKQVRNGELDKEMRSSFGVTRQLTRR
jgi:soluble lytic murein transglycosylase-like protein